MTGSADLFDHDGRSPRSSINHVTVHDGFTLADLVSYERKHNEANGEDNRDGSDDNYSTNCGVEGPTDDPAILELRRQLRRNHLASLMLAQGVPLLLAGDEVGNSQNGNNNAYCQDNPIGWVDWSALGREGDDMTDLIGQLTALRRRFPQLRPRAWVDGRRPDGSFGVLWLTPQATEMTEQDWNFPEGRFLSYLLGSPEQGEPPLYIVLNAAPETIEFTLPTLPDYRTLDDAARVGAAARGPARSSRPAPSCRLSRARCWRSRERHDRRRPLWRGVASGRGNLPPLGAGGQARRAHARPRASAAAAGGGLVRDHDRGPARRRALQVPHRRRDRGAGSGLAFSAAGRERAERGHRPRPLRMAHARMAWPAMAGRGDPGASRRHVHAWRHVSVRDRAARRRRRCRHHRDRADADRRLRGPAQLGLRRRAALRARQRLWPSR